MFQRLAFVALGSAVSLAVVAVPVGVAARQVDPPPAGAGEPSRPAEPALPEPAVTPEATSAEAPPAAPIDPEAALMALGRELELLVSETGPDQPWTLHLHNRGATPVGVMADPGLLWFEVTLPSSSATLTCRLPEPLWPKAMRRRAELVLPPGERFSRRFDPRFFCFADLMQTALVPGARVIPHFGWPHETRTGAAGGKRVEQPLTPRPPFMAWVLEGAKREPPVAAEPASDAEEGSDSPAAEPWRTPNEGLKSIVGPALVLSPAYSKWSERSPPLEEGLNVALLAGSDAEDERGAVVTIALGNAGSMPQTLVVRRELVSFDVVGPDGSFECPTGDMGSPDIASFTNLGVRKTEQLVIRLIEMCPRGGFARPGLYEVRATWHSKFSGQALNVEGFVGTLTTPRPALVRVRSGERASFLRAAPMVAQGGDASAGGGAPAEAVPAPDTGGPEAPAPDTVGPEAPADHDAPPGSGEDPGPLLPEPAPAAPEGTSVE
jgi:hypothetical protein